MGGIYAPAGRLMGGVLILLLAVAACGPGAGPLPFLGGAGSISEGTGATTPLAVGTRFLQALIGGNPAGAMEMIAADRRSPGTTQFMQSMDAGLRGCAASQAAFSSRADGRAPSISVVFTPACGDRKVLNPSSYGQMAAGPVLSCVVGLESIAGEWKPRPDTIDCKSP
jgi:hypothetical protein